MVLPWSILELILSWLTLVPCCMSVSLTLQSSSKISPWGHNKVYSRYLYIFNLESYKSANFAIRYLQLSSADIRDLSSSLTVCWVKQRPSGDLWWKIKISVSLKTMLHFYFGSTITFIFSIPYTFSLLQVDKQFPSQHISLRSKLYPVVTSSHWFYVNKLQAVQSQRFLFHINLGLKGPNHSIS